MLIALLNNSTRCCLLLICLFIATSAFGQTTYHVTNGSDTGIGSLRQAVSSSSSGDIIVFDGNFQVNLVTEILINHPLTITGNGKGNTIIDGGGVTRIFSVATVGSGLSLNNLTIQNAKALVNTGGGAIASDGTLIITNVRFYNNTASVSDNTNVYGGAIYLTGSAGGSTITSCTFENNKVIKIGDVNLIGSGGAIGVSATNGLTINNSTFDNNTATASAGAIYSSTAVTINTASFADNKASYDADKSAYNTYVGSGGAIYATNTLILNGDLSFKNNSTMGAGGAIQKNNNGAFNTSGLTSFLFFNNISGSTTITGGGGAISTAAALTLTSANGVVMRGNVAYGHGGAIWASGALNLDGVTQITNNSATLGGGAIYVSAPLTLKNTTISDNKAGYNPVTKVYYNLAGSGSGGGGIQAGAAVTLIGDIVMQRDTVAGYGGAFYWSSTGASYVFDVTQLKSLLISENAAVVMAHSAGGGIYTKGNMSLTATDSVIIRNNSSISSGGGIYTSAADMTLTKASIRNNASGTTGAGITNAGTLTINNSTVNNNKAIGNGGGIYSGATLNLNNVTIYANSSGGNGGGLLSSISTLNGVTIANNTATGNGGGLYASNTLTLQNSITVSSNTATTRGGGIYKTPSGTFVTTDVTSLKIIDNKTTSNNFGVGDGGGGIYTLVPLTLVPTNNAIITGNTTMSGGGILASGTRLNLQGVTITGNSAKANGGGIYADSTLTLSASTIKNNKAGYDPATSSFAGAYSGGGIYAADALILQGSIMLTNNMANSGGGGIWKSSTGAFTTSALTDITIDKNTAITGAGGGVYSMAALSLKNATITDNITGDRGGGIMADGMLLTLTDAVILRNKAGYDYLNNVFFSGLFNGGGVYAWGPLTLTGSIKFEDNQAANEGGALWKIGTSAFTTTGLTSLVVNRNSTIAGDGGGIYSLVTLNLSGVGTVTVTNNSAGANGGGIRSGGGTVLTLNGGTISNNTAKASGGGIYANGQAVIAGIVASNNVAKISGGGIYAADALTLAANTTISNNKAGYDFVAKKWLTTGDGGGIYAAGNLVLKDNSTFELDTATNNGGAIYKGATGTIVSDNLTLLQVSKNLARSGSGGGIYTAGALTFSGTNNVNIDGNTAKIAGGGIYATAGLTLSGSTISNNTAGYDVATATWITTGNPWGGGIYAGSTLTTTGTSVLNNTASGTGGGIYAAGISSVSGNVNGNISFSLGGGIYAAGTLVLNNATISNNKGGYNVSTATWGMGDGGGLYAANDLTLSGNIVFENDTTATAGGGIFKSANGIFNASAVASLTIRNNVSRSSAGGGINSQAEANISVSGVSDISNNTAYATGGGLYTTKNLVLGNLNISKNRAGYDVATNSAINSKNGGGVYTSMSLTATNVQIHGNTSTGSGGGIYAAKATTITDANISYNRSGTSTSNSSGGGIYLAADSLVLKGNITFVKDSALQAGAVGTNNGGGAIAIGNASAKLIAMHSKGLKSLLIDSCYTDNGGDGGAIAAAISQVDNNAAIYIVGNASCPITISNNFAARNGGAISARSKTVYLQGIYFRKNSTGNSGAVGGGAVFLSNTGTTPAAFPRTVLQCTFDENSIIASSGAAIAVGSNNTTTTTITNNTFYNNKSTGNGNTSALYIASPTTVSFNTFYGNTPARSIAASGGVSTLNGNILQDNIGTSTVSGFSSGTASYNVVGAASDATTLGSTNKVSSDPSQLFTSTTPSIVGSATPVLRIKTGSLAHNIVPPSVLWGVNYDQRDSVRMVGCGYDAGSVEIQSAATKPNQVRDTAMCPADILTAKVLKSLITAPDAKDTTYYMDRACTTSLVMPFAVTKDTTVYVRFISIANCYDTLAIHVTKKIVPQVLISGNLSPLKATSETYTFNHADFKPGYTWSVTGGAIQGANNGHSVTVLWGSSGTSGTINLSGLVSVDGCPVNNFSQTIFFAIDCVNGTSYLFRDDFGGNNTSDPLIAPAAAPVGWTTDYTPFGPQGAAPVNPPSNPQFSLAKNFTKYGSNLFAAWVTNMDDHTSPANPNTGYMMLVNATGNPSSKVYQRTINDLCMNTSLYFRASVANLIKSTGYNTTHANPNIRVTLTDGQGHLLAELPSQIIPKGAAWTYITIPFFSTNTSTVVVTIYDLETNTTGNDFALDDITIGLCVPKTEGMSSSSSNLCAGSPVTFNASVPNMGSFGDYAGVLANLQYKSTANGTWSNLGTATLTQNSGAGTIDMSYTLSTTTIGNAGYYRFVVGNNSTINSSSCRSQSDSIQITVNAKPVITVTSPTEVCEPSTVNIAGSATGAASYKYYSDAACTNELASTIINTVGTTNYWVKGTNANGCVSDAVQGTVTIYAKPVIIVNSPTAVCEPSTVNIAGSATGTVSYKYYSDAACMNELASTIINTVGTTNYWVKGTSTDGCVSDAVQGSVTINPSPEIKMITGAFSMCAGTVIETAADVTNANPADVVWSNYASTGSGAWSVTGALKSTFEYSTTARTNDTVIYIYASVHGLGVCSAVSAKDSTKVTIYGKPLITVTSPAAVCAPGTVDVAGTASGAATYQYYSNAACTNVLASTVISTVGTTNYWVKGTSAQGCVSDAVQGSVTINAKPVIIVNSPTAVCEPSSVDIAGSATGTASYKYYSDAACMNELASTIINTVGTTNYWVKGTSTDGCVSDAVQGSVTINAKPEFAFDGVSICAQDYDLKSLPLISGDTANLILKYYSDTYMELSTTLVPTGTYHIIGTTNAGCSDTSTVNIIVKQSIKNYPNIRINICNTSGNVNLSKYLDIEGYKNITWSVVTPTAPPITNAEKGTVDAGLFGVHNTYIYEYIIENECIKDTAQMYITAIGDDSNLTDQTVVICYETRPAEAIQLNQILGIEAGGTWSYDPALNIYVNKPGAPFTGAVLFNAKDAWNISNPIFNYTYNGSPAKKMIFTYTPAVGSCVQKSYTITIIITDDLVP